MIPEALCGEAPKGQPMIRRETLVAVCVEAPEGQPMNHGPHPRKQPGRVPKGNQPKRQGRRQGPPSSQWKRVGGRRGKEVGDHSHEPMHGEWGRSWRT